MSRRHSLAAILDLHSIPKTTVESEPSTDRVTSGSSGVVTPMSRVRDRETVATFKREIENEIVTLPENKAERDCRWNDSVIAERLRLNKLAAENKTKRERIAAELAMKQQRDRLRVENDAKALSEYRENQMAVLLRNSARTEILAIVEDATPEEIEAVAAAVKSAGVLFEPSFWSSELAAIRLKKLEEA